MLRLNRSAAPARPAASAAVARARLQRALGADRHPRALAGAMPSPSPAPADELLGRLLGEPLACERRRP